MDVTDQSFQKFEDPSYLYEWVNLYNEFYIYKNNELNMVFAKVLKSDNSEDVIELIFENNLTYYDVEYERGKNYGDWWVDDCESAYLMDGTKPLDWMKKKSSKAFKLLEKKLFITERISSIKKRMRD